MKAVNMSRDHSKLNELSKQLYIENDWKLPQGFVDPKLKSPLNFTREEWQQAQRNKQKPQDIRAAIQESWGMSDSRKAFENALKERGFTLAKGDRRGFIVIDTYGEVRSLPHQLNKKAKDLNSRLGDPKKLMSVDDAKTLIAKQLNSKFGDYLKQLSTKHAVQMNPLQDQKRDMTVQHRCERAKQCADHEKRQTQEQIQRSERLRKGFKGLWDRLTGTYQRTVKKNEHEATKCAARDLREKEALINGQLAKRQELQKQFTQLRKNQKQERLDLYKGMNKHYEGLERQQELRELLKQERQDRKRSLRQDNDPTHEPEL